jgi:hypothetical protein
MNPAKASTVAQKAEFRQQYINNLKLLIANDTLNSNANRYYDRTNDILTQPLDSRNAEEKLADIQNLKNYIVKSLQNKTPNPVGFVSRLNDDDVEYVAQNINRIIDIIKKKYAIGIPAGSVMPLLQQLRDEDSQYQDIKDLATGRVDSSTQAFLDDQDEDDYDDGNVPDLISMEDYALQNAQNERDLFDEYQNMTYGRNESKMNEPFLDPYSVSKLNYENMTAKDLLRNIPQGLHSKNILLNAENRAEPVYKTPEKVRPNELLSLEQFEDLKNKEQKDYLRNTLGIKISKENTTKTDYERLYKKYLTMNQLRQASPIESPTPIKPKRFITFEKLSPNKKQMAMIQVGLQFTGNPTMDNEAYQQYINAYDSFISGKGMRHIVGCGINRPKAKVSPENIDFSKSIEPIKSYIPFGRYVLNRHKLNDNILMIKHMKGGAIGAIPTTHISSGLSKALKHFVDTQLPPQFDMISDLSKEDKELLHRVAKQAHLLDKMNIPTPNLTEEEQENHRFDILKGEINAGNDSKDVIKEFKLLLLKFIHKNKLPRRQAQEILLDLIALGY